MEQLENIEVKGRASKTGYDRDLFGAGWNDPDRNGCDARNDILGRDLQNVTAKPGTQGCVITSGTLQDPFTGQMIDFIRGQGTSTKVQIDHLVALSDAWQKGAQHMSPQERLAFANDPLNLLAVDGPSNASKGDGDAATWLPPKKGFRCDYVARQTAVKAKHGLWMTKAEHDVIQRILTIQCPGKEALPTTG
ncbi:HNH endonuclease family protein [Paeniglutamicibacter sp. NPDC091659]|uniref:HNH endonuclease family protein n=1 Tax=Paeniglutamicibacter sp. NPDC091659 TaxID=3364389 RepID=UPI003825472B